MSCFSGQGYEGSLLKVTSKNGKTASVSLSTGKFDIYQGLIRNLCANRGVKFAACRFRDVPHQGRCRSCQTRSSGWYYHKLVYYEIRILKHNTVNEIAALSMNT